MTTATAPTPRTVTVPQAAALYTNPALGLALTPLRQNTKSPYLDGWHAPERCLRTPEEVALHWQGHPHDGAGVVLGLSGLCTLDLDELPHARAALAAVGLDLDALLTAPGALKINGRPDRGKLVYRVPEGAELTRRVLTWPAAEPGGRPLTVLELRGGPVQDVLPPSVHPDTKRPYTWEPRAPRSRADVPELPPELLELWQRFDAFSPVLAEACPWGAPAAPARTGGAAPAGGWAEVRRAVLEGLPLGAYLAEIEAEPRGRGRYLCPFHPERSPSFWIFEGSGGWSRWVCAHGGAPVGRTTPGGYASGDVVDLHAWRLGVAPGPALADLARRLGVPLPGPAPERVGAVGVEGASEEWEAVVPLDRAEPPRLDGGILPAWLGEMVEAVSVATETPRELAALMGLAAVAAAVQKTFRVNPEPGYFEPLNLWAVAALDPGNRKSAVKGWMTRPLTEWERAEAERLAPAIREATSRRASALDRIKSLRGKAAAAKATEEAEHLEEEVRALEAVVPEVPVAPRVWVQDVTPERLGVLLAEHGERLALLSDEGGIFETLGGRYSSGIPNLDLFLQAHSGDPVRVDRGSREPVLLEHPALTIGLSPQPEVLRGLADKPGFRGRGLIARFLYALPPSPLGRRRLEPHPVPAAVARTYSEGLGILLTIKPSSDEHGRPRPFLLAFDPEAYLEWKAFQRATEAELADGGRFEHCRDWGGKLPGAAARLAGLLHCVEASRPWEGPIRAETMTRALTLAAVLSYHALAVFDLMGADPSLEAARRVWAWVERGDKAEFKARDAFDALKGRFKRMSEINPALDVLAERFYIREAEREEQPGRGRPSRVFRVNPALSGGWR